MGPPAQDRQNKIFPRQLARCQLSEAISGQDVRQLALAVASSRLHDQFHIPARDSANPYGSSRNLTTDRGQVCSSKTSGTRRRGARAEFVPAIATNFGLNTHMWDTKRQIVWLAAGISFGTWIVYMDSRDDMGKFDPEVFVFWELVLLAIIGALFYLYSRKKR